MFLKPIRVSLSQLEDRDQWRGGGVDLQTQQCKAESAIENSQKSTPYKISLFLFYGLFVFLILWIKVLERHAFRIKA